MGYTILGGRLDLFQVKPPDYRVFWGRFSRFSMLLANPMLDR